MNLMSSVAIALIAISCQSNLVFGKSEKITDFGWDKIKSGATLRLFSGDKYHAGGSYGDIWDKMGESIECTVHDNLKVDLKVPKGFESKYPLKLVTHGYGDTTMGTKTNFVNAYMKKYNRKVNVILLDWSSLAAKFQWENWHNYAYNEAARNAIDVGNYVGRCLAQLSKNTGIKGENMHFAGHSLGAHVVGQAGRIYKEASGSAVGRVTGLDPAGPRFVDGWALSALPELNRNRISTESANFVDIIHSCGGLKPAAADVHPRFGDLHQLGHMDFYPNGGEAQPGNCGPICSHGRAVAYFLHSILEPKLFASYPCASYDNCKGPSSKIVTAYMGEPAEDSYTGGRKVFYQAVPARNWDQFKY